MSQQIKRKRQKFSWVWDYFSVVNSVRIGETTKATCDICKQLVTYKGPTTCLSNHLQIRHSISKMTPNNKVTDNKENENSDYEDFDLTLAGKYRSDIDTKRAKFDKNCADFIIKNNLPLLTIAKPEFIKLFDPSSHPICVKTLRYVIIPDMVNSNF